MDEKFTLNVDGRTHTVTADPDTPLLYVLRDDLGLNNPHFGCGLAQCGACTVHLDGRPIPSCITTISAVGQAKITTLAGLGTPEKPHPLQTAYIEEQVPQCGYCITGWLMTAAAFLRDNKKPTDAQIGAAMPFDPARAAGDAFVAGAKPPLTPDQLSSYIAVNADGTVLAFYGKIDGGQGLHVAIAQMVAEELDVPFKAVKVVMGDTGTSVNQGGASGATGVQEGGKQLRAAAAEARRVLVELAAERLGVSAERLSVDNGVVHTGTEMAKSVSYAELMGGRYFNVTLAWNGKIGNPLYAPGKAKPKDPKDYKIVGQPIKREDVAPLVFAQRDFCTDVKVPGMVHGRMIRPAIAGAVPATVDEGSIKHIPGARVVWNQGFLGVVVDEAFKSAARIIEAEYEWPFQSHASMGPACAVVAIENDQVTLWTGSQKPHFTRDGVAAILGLPPDKVRAIWIPGPGSYGRNDAGDAAMDAALLAKAVGKPVRLQYMRDQGTGWDPKGPASIHR